MFVWGSQEQSFFLQTLWFYCISRDGSKNVNIRTCEQMILGQLRIWARQAKNAPLFFGTPFNDKLILIIKWIFLFGDDVDIFWILILVLELFLLKSRF